MKLSEILELKYSNSKNNSLKDVYGIIYRIHCIPENKSYIGQTFSHICNKDKFIRAGVIRRIKIHYNRDRHTKLFKNKPLYQSLNKYSSEDFEVYEEQRIYGKEISRINQIEGEYMKQYNSLCPNGYNIEEVGKTYTKLHKKLCEYYNLDIENFVYEDTTRSRRCKDICVGKYFGLNRSEINLDSVLELILDLDVESVRLVNTNGFRILVKIKGEKDNIRIYFNGTKEECLEYAEIISNNVILGESFRGKDCYKYQCKLDKILEENELLSVRGFIYDNKARDIQTYILIFYGIENNIKQTLYRISFGGKSLSIEESFKTAMDFVDRFKKSTNCTNIKYNFKKPIIE